jgi:hypothetical protein
VVESPQGDLSAAEVNGAATAIEEWLAGVRQALRAVEAIPSRRGFPLAWIDVVDEPGSNEKRVLVSKPLVQLYADSHLVRRLKALDRALAIESLSVQDDERTERLRTLFAAITDYRTKRLTQRIRAQVTKFVAPYLVFIVGPAVILGGVDAQDVRAAFVLAVLLASAVVYFVAARVLTVPLGFIPRRALWSGGVTVQSIDRKGHRTERRWQGFLPTVDLYRAEAAVFDALRIPMAPERPLDISVALDVVFGTLIAAAVVGVVAMVLSGAPVGWIVFVALIVIGVAARVVIDSGSNYRMRRARKESQRIEPVGGGPAVATL